MRRFIIISVLLFLGAASAEGQHYDRGYERVPSSPFIKKGSWMVGGNFNYSQHINDGYDFLVISDINSKGYNVSVNPRALYMFKDNMGAGLRLSYGRGMLDLGSVGISAGDIAMSADNCYQLQHKYGAHGVYRAYIPLAGAKRIAMFADLMLGGTLKQGKVFNAGGDSVYGYYQSSYSLDLSVDPGLIAFLADNLSLEVNVGIFGVSYNWNNQVRNQVYNGNSDFFSAGFMVNFLSIGVGLSYYFQK